MTEQEYNQKLANIKKQAQKEEIALVKEYGLSLARFKVGDIIKDSRWVVLIESITVSRLFDMVQPVYNGLELKKDLTPRKDGNRVAIHDNNGIQLIRSAELTNQTAPSVSGE